jgi:hypothetical protein
LSYQLQEYQEFVDSISEKLRDVNAGKEMMETPDEI